MSRTYIPVALRKQVFDRAGGCREYCRIPDVATFAPREIDHIIAEKHGGRTESANLALCCTVCNKEKGSDLASIDPETEKIVPLYHPRQDYWREHFRWSGAEFVPLTPTGEIATSGEKSRHGGEKH